MNFDCIARKATVEDARDIASRIREADRREALAFVGVSPSILLPLAAKEGNAMVGLSHTGTPEVIFGATPVVEAPKVGMVWLMATKELDKNPKTKLRFLRNCKPILELLNDQYPILGNYVDERNELHLKWLDWMGFKVLKRIPEWGASKVPFLQVIKIREE